jgi:uncharacterized protein (TIGR02266 family)
MFEYACIFARLQRERLGLAARFVGAIPAFVCGAEGELDVHHCLATGYTAAVIRADAEVFTPDVLARLGFWSARAGARSFQLELLPDDERARFSAELSSCDRATRGVTLRQAQEASERFFRTLGVVSSVHPTGARMVLAMDIDGPGAEGISYSPGPRGLFVAGGLAPPVGDQLVISVRHTGSRGPMDGWATVVEVRARKDAAPGRPAGFMLRIEGPSQLHEHLVHGVRARPGHDTRAAPRYPVKAPVKVARVAVANASDPPRTAPAPDARVRVEYATEQELAEDWIENLSQGGAFVRTSTPHPEGTELAFELALPDNARLEGNARVAFVNDDGMGLRFVLSAEQDAMLSAAIARISARPKRALVVDDDALSCRILADALSARGFEVLTAQDASSGLHLLIDELLALDMFVTDLVMPGLGGEALIRMIREAGGESELAIVAVTGRLAPSVERVLQAAGADAVLDKALGPELIAEAVDAVLERRRLVRREDAA